MNIKHNIGSRLACATILGLSVFLPTNVAAQNGTPGKPVVENIRDKQVTLSWRSAEPIYGLFDDFEGHTDFAIHSPGEVGWQYADMDRDQVYNVGDYLYTNNGQPAAFRIWNPSKTVPAYTTGRGLPHSGDKCLISLATVNDYRNDWLISPDLTRYRFTDSIRLSFWARAFNNAYGKECINIGYSTTGTNSAAFTFLNGKEPIEIPESSLEHPDMYYFEYKFPGDAKYIAINCVTSEGQALLIDDIAIGTNKVMPNKSSRNYLTGYNVYRGSEKANAELITQTSFIDNVTAYGDVAYSVEAVFGDGSTTRSEVLDAHIPDIHLLPLVERWENYDLTDNFWVQDNTGSPDGTDYWKIDYREGGLIIPAATFVPRASLRNYSSYCLVSKELDATDLDGVMLAYDMAGHFYSGMGSDTREYMKVEVYDGTQWRTLETHTNENGSFGYDRFYIDLSDYVKGKKFSIRFNAGGESAFSVLAWYVSYVKVYEKAQAAVSGRLSRGGEPVAGATVTFTSQDNDVYTAVSGTDGRYSLPAVDAGQYTVTAVKTAYNPFSAETTVEKGSKTYDITMTQPAFAAPAPAAYELKAEATANGILSLQNKGDGPARVNFYVDYGAPAGQTPALKPVKTFRPKDLLQAALCFDGTYFYTANSTEFADGVIEKYDRDGNYIESFQPSIHVRRYFGMVFDGADFYTANNDSIIRRIDFETKQITGEIVTPVSNINHIAYDEARDAFYVGALNTIALVGKDGRLIEEETILPDVLFAGSVYDPYFKEGPTMWILDQSQANNAANSYTFAVIRRFDLATKTVKDDYVFDCATLDGFVYGNPNIGKVWGEGMFGTTRYLDGHFVIMGTILSDPGLIYILDMYETDNWLRPGGYRMEIPAGAAAPIPYTVDAADLKDGETRTADLHVVFDPAVPATKLSVTLTVKGKADLARPTGLNVSVQDDKAAVLNWQVPDAASAPQSYKVYRNGEVVGTASAGTTAYTDDNLKAGLYRYEVAAVYAGGESAKSKAAEAEIVTGIPCYRPQNLTARNVRNEEIALSWQNPSAVGSTPALLRWGTGTVYDYISLYEGGTFTGAALWTPDDLADYRDMIIGQVAFVPMTAGGQYTLKIWEDNTLVHEQAVGAGFEAGKAYEVKLNKNLTINDRRNLRVGIEAVGGAALGIDAGPAVENKGNWVYANTFNAWMTLTVMGGSDANFCIGLMLSPKAQPETNTAKAYNVYRDGVRINTEAVTGTTYSDRPAAGVYTYTVTAVHADCESYASAPATARIVDLQAHAAPDDLTARVVMNREVNLQWNYPNTTSGTTDMAKSGTAYEPFAYVRDFDLREKGEAAVVTDGNAIYTSFYNRNGTFNRYDMQGRFIETFTIDGVGQILDLTYDGTYFYGGGGETKFYRMDFGTRRLVETMTLTDNVRHCTYIPDLNDGQGGFEIGDWTTSYFVSRNGTYLNKAYPNPEGAFGSAYHDGKLYYFQQRRNALCEIVEVDFRTLTATGNRADLNAYSQYTASAEARAGGLATLTSPNGSTILLANLQNGNEPNKLVWVEATPDDYVTGFNLYRDGIRVNGETPLVKRGYTDVVTQAGTYLYTVAAIFVDGQEGEKSAPVSIEIVEPTHCEAPVNVAALVEDRDVRLQWTSVIDQLADKDDMESYSHLTTGTIGAYLTLDADRQPTYAPEAWTFGGAGQPASFRVLDQRLLNPAQNNLAFSGNKFLAAFGAAKSELAAVTYSHDWIIMPADATAGSTQPQWLSFMARGLETGGQEAFRVAYSLNGLDTTDFIRLSQTAETVNCLWTRFIFDLPAGTKYVAIEYLSGNGRALLLDDITVGHGACVFRPDAALSPDDEFVEKIAGYSIYRDGQLLTPEPVVANTYFDGNRSNGTYTYTVKALYNTSCESEASPAVTAKVDYRAPMSAPHNLAGKAQGNTVTLTWEAPLYAEDKTLSYAGTDVSTAFGYTSDAVYYAVHHWEASEMLGVFGYRIYGVTALFAERPSKLDLVIFQNDELVYEQDVTATCKELDVSAFLLNTPYEVDYGKSLSVGFRITAVGESYTIGVDKGPVVSGKGDRYSDDGIHWSSADYYQGTGGNWFFATILELPAPANANLNGFQGYLVYRDGEAARKELVQALTFKDSDLSTGTHTYAVAAVYTGGERVSESIQIRVTANEELEDNRLYISPNPASDRFMVYGPYERLDIMDLRGERRLSHEAAQGAEVNVSALASGVYFVRITTAGGTTVRKLVVK